jgi:hypothetical protein
MPQPIGNHFTIQNLTDYNSNFKLTSNILNLTQIPLTHKLHTITIANQLGQFTSLQLIQKLTRESHTTTSPSRATPSPGNAPNWLHFLPY